MSFMLRNLFVTLEISSSGRTTLPASWPVQNKWQIISSYNSGDWMAVTLTFHPLARRTNSEDSQYWRYFFIFIFGVDVQQYSKNHSIRWIKLPDFGYLGHRALEAVANSGQIYKNRIQIKNYSEFCRVDWGRKPF